MCFGVRIPSVLRPLLAPFVSSLLVLLLVLFAHHSLSAQDSNLPVVGSADQRLPGDSWARLPAVSPQTQGKPPGDSAASSSEAGYPGPNWTCMVFDSLRDDNWEVYAISGGDPTPRRLTRYAEEDVDAAVNRGCTAVVYVSYRGKNLIPTIFRMGIDGSGNTALTGGDYADYDPKWSPDGKRIVFTSLRTGNSDIFIMDADGSNVRRLTDWGAGDFDPSWSPDGRQIVWVRQVDEERGILAVRNVDGNGGDTALTEPLRFLQHPMYAPDGREIGFDYDHDGDSWNDAAIVTLPSDFRPATIRMVTQGGRFLEKWFDAWSPVEPELGQPRGLVVSTLQYKISGRKLVLDYTQIIEVPSNTAIHSSSFDLRADRASTDTIAPTATLYPLPEYFLPEEFVELRWTGQDSGVSGLHHYEMEYMLDRWNFLPTQTVKTWQPYHTGSKPVRVRSVDGAGNRSPWSERSLLGVTKIVSGHIFDNRGFPLPEVVVTLVPRPGFPLRTNQQGYYEVRYTEWVGSDFSFDGFVSPWQCIPHSTGDTLPARARFDGYCAELSDTGYGGLYNGSFGFSPIDAMWTVAGEEVAIEPLRGYGGAVRFGGATAADPTSDHTSSIEQSISPGYQWDTKRNSTLSFFYSMTVDAPTASSFQVVLIDHATLLRTVEFATSSATAGWQYQWIDLAARPSNAFTISFEYHHPAGQAPATVQVRTIDVTPWNTPVVLGLPGERIAAQVPFTLTMSGLNFAPGAVVRLEAAQPCIVTRIDDEHLECYFAEGLTAGLYRVVVTNPEGHYAMPENLLLVGNPTYLPDIRRER